MESRLTEELESHSHFRHLEIPSQELRSNCKQDIIVVVH